MCLPLSLFNTYNSWTPLSHNTLLVKCYNVVWLGIIPPPESILNATISKLCLTSLKLLITYVTVLLRTIPAGYGTAEQFWHSSTNDRCGRNPQTWPAATPLPINNTAPDTGKKTPFPYRGFNMRVPDSAHEDITENCELLLTIPIGGSENAALFQVMWKGSLQ